jgi:hypothetical protein
MNKCDPLWPYIPLSLTGHLWRHTFQTFRSPHVEVLTATAKKSDAALQVGSAELVEEITSYGKFFVVTIRFKRTEWDWSSVQLPEKSIRATRRYMRVKRNVTLPDLVQSKTLCWWVLCRNEKQQLCRRCHVLRGLYDFRTCDCSVTM